MFEQQMELDKKEGSGIGIVTIIVLLVAVVVGGVVMGIKESMQTMSADEARTQLAAKLSAETPATTQFHLGTLPYAGLDKPSDSQYALLEKAGLLRRKKVGGATPAAKVDLTPAGQKLLAAIPGVQKMTEHDGTTRYSVPLASKKLTAVDKIVKKDWRHFEVTYHWQWQPTAAGELFDIHSHLVQSLPLYERSTLIDQHGAAYYRAAPSEAKIVLTKKMGSGAIY